MIIVIIFTTIIIVIIIITAIYAERKFRNRTGFSASWFHLSSPALISKASMYLIRKDNQSLTADSVKDFVSDISKC
jgi:hypothetical protein